MGQKVLVTGATGFTGSHLCRFLAEKGHEVHALARKNSSLEALKGISVEIAHGDLTDSASLRQAVKGIETVYHIAAVYREEGIPDSVFRDVNVQGTKNLLEAGLSAGISRFVHCSTVGVHGEIKDPPANEDAPFYPGDLYQETKLEGEQAARTFFAKTGLPGVIFRPVGIYGPGDTRFLKLFKLVKKGIMIGNGRTLYHLTFVEDLVAGIELCGTREEALGQTYILGGDGCLNHNEIAAIIAGTLGVNPPRWHIPSGPIWLAGLLCELICKPFSIEPPLYRRRVDFFRKDRSFDISKAKRELGYNPKVEMEEGTARTAEWYQGQGLI